MVNALMMKILCVSDSEPSTLLPSLKGRLHLFESTFTSFLVTNHMHYYHYQKKIY